MFAMPSLAGGMRVYGHDLEFWMPYPVDLDYVLVSGGLTIRKQGGKAPRGGKSESFRTNPREYEGFHIEKVQPRTVRL